MARRFPHNPRPPWRLNIAQERVADMPLGRMGQPEDIAVRMSVLRSQFGGTLTPVGQAGGE